MNAAKVLKKLDRLVILGKPCRIVTSAEISEDKDLEYFIRYHKVFFDEHGGYCVERNSANGKITKEVYYLEYEPYDPKMFALGLVLARYKERDLSFASPWFYKESKTYCVGGYYGIAKKIDILLGKVPKPAWIKRMDIVLNKIQYLDWICIKHIVKSKDLSIEEAAKLIKTRSIPGCLKEMEMMPA